jgi:hypothetical protein
LASAAVGDARALDLPDACADAVLMHGPLYHLPSAPTACGPLARRGACCAPAGCCWPLASPATPG